mmetsp:Transcript_33034/g.92489  ORF Transcript_33034/g.92489 Transcript_33034/m.92489 type:complete len:342 (+) Transcript_33034:19-1044(+)
MGWVGKVVGVCVVLLALLIGVLRIQNRGKLFGVTGEADLSLDMRGQEYIVTGSNTGLGKEIATMLAGMGGNVVMAVRSLEKGEKARQSMAEEAQRLARASGHQAAGSLTVMQLDLSSFASIRTFVENYRATGRQLDVLVNNAAVISTNPAATADGLPLIMGVNHYGPFLLSNLLVDSLARSDDGRIVFVASDAHSFVTVSATLAEHGRIGGPELSASESFEAYSYSKLANIYNARSLARRHPDVVTTALHPGFVATDIAREADGILSVLYTIAANLVAMSSFEGAQNSVWLATDPAARQYSGAYFVHVTPVELSATVPDGLTHDKAEAALWTASCKATESC